MRNSILQALALLILGTGSAGICAAPTLHGTVETRAGETLEGELRFEKQHLIILNSDGKERTISASELKTAELRPGNPESSPHPILAPRKRIGGLMGNYYRMRDFGGGAPNERVDSVIDFEWGSQSPMPDFPRENFSVRWQGEIETTTTGNYIFHTQSDDGVRLWIDNRLLIDRWLPQANTERICDVTLEGKRRYPIVLEYFQGLSRANMQLLWTTPGTGKGLIPALQLSHIPGATRMGAQNGLLGYYFNNPDLTGKPISRIDPFINSPWRDRAPFPDFDEEKFSVRWEGEVVGPLTGKVLFQPSANDGLRLWVGGKLLTEQWSAGSNQGQHEFPMQKGKSYPIRMDYFQDGGDLYAKLAWSGPGLSHQVVPQTHLLTSPKASAQYYNGVILKGGSFLAGEVRKMDEVALELRIHGSKPDRQLIRIPRIYLAAIIFDSSNPDKLVRFRKREAGCLLRGGDYLESNDLSIKEGKVIAESVLFGRRTLLPDEILMIMLASPANIPAKYELRTTSGSILRINSLTLSDKNALIKDNSNYRFTLPSDVLSCIHGIVGRLKP